MFNPKLSALNRYETWTNGIHNKVAEVIDAYRQLDGVPGYSETPEYHTAGQRVDAALQALPFWLRWIFG